ncbi:MAG: FAD-binding oxidoreductase [Roseiflexaceae bacterium]
MSDILSFIHDEKSLCDAYMVHGVVPVRVAFPPDVQSAAHLMQHAAQQGWRVVAWGGGTQQLIGAPPQAIDLVVVMTHLNQVLHHEPNDLTIAVGAGMTLGALRRYLAQHGQMLPVDGALADTTTIGGMIATAADGPRRAMYGVLRDMMIGIEVIEVNGQRSRAGGMVVKNVSGFDMMKLYHGSFGTLALIVSANFKLVPIPPVAAGVLAVFPTLNDADAFVADVMASQLTPVTCELIDATLLNALGVDGVWGVLLGCEGPQAAVDRHLAELPRRATQHHGTSHAYVADAYQRVLQVITDASQVAALAADELVIRWATLPGDVAALIARLPHIAAHHGGECVIHARASVGSGYVRVRGVDAAAHAAWLAAVPEAVWVATHATLPRYWHTPSGGADVMARIRAEFDPQRRLNPGRFVV